MEEELKATEDLWTKNSVFYELKLLEMEEAQQVFTDKLIDTWMQVGSSISSVLKNISDSPELAESIQALEGVAKLAVGIYSGNIGSAVSGAAGLLNVIISKRQREWAEREERSKEFWDEQNELIKKTNELKISTAELNSQFVDFARSMFGFSADFESAMLQNQQALRNFNTALSEWQIEFGLEIRKLIHRDRSNQRDVSDGYLGDPNRSITDLPSLFKDIFEGLNESQKDIILRGGQEATDLIKQIIDTTVYGAKILDEVGFKYEDVVHQMRTMIGFEKVGDIQKEIFSPLMEGVVDFPSALRNIRDKMFELVENSENFFTDLEGNVRAIVSPKDLIGAIERVFKDSLERATTKEEVEAAFAEKVASYQSIKESPELMKALTQDEIIDLTRFIQDDNKIRSKELENALKSLPAPDFKQEADVINDSARKIVNAFEKGAITYEEAIEQLDKLQGKISSFPNELKTELESALRKSRISVLEGVEARRVGGEEILKDITKDSKKLKEDIQDLNEEMEKVVDEWNGLLKAREDIISKFESESEQLINESKNTVSQLESEQASVLGTFTFGETQDARTKRFQDAKNIQNKIIEEFEKLDKAIIRLSENRDKELERVNLKLEELQKKYGSIEGVTIFFWNKQNELVSEFKDSILESISTLKELGFEIENIPDFEIGGLEDLLKISNFINNIIGQIKNLPTSEELEGLQEKEKQILRSSVLATPLSATYPTLTSVSPGILPEPEDTQVSTEESSGGLFGGTKISHTDDSSIYAQHGFEGLVKKPTGFVVGENNRPEMVSVTPMSELSRLGESMLGKNITNINITEQIDLRGAYGIDSPETAAKVWKTVWAPARRRVVNRIIDMRGRIQR